MINFQNDCTAFPEGWNIETTPTIGLRDYFAAHETSLPPTSWVQSKFGSQIEGIWELKGVEMSECLSEWRYQVADAMLKKRGE